MIVSKATFLVFIFLYIWLGYSTNTELIFYVLNLFNQLNRQFGFALPLNFSRIAQLYASLSRINKVLKAEEVNKTLDDNAENPMVALKSVSFRLANKDILKNISMNIPKPGLTVVSGTVGSGKSSLLKIILQDYPVSEGESLNNYPVQSIIQYSICRSCRCQWQHIVRFTGPLAFPFHSTTEYFIWWGVRRTTIQ